MTTTDRDAWRAEERLAQEASGVLPSDDRSLCNAEIKRLCAMIAEAEGPRSVGQWTKAELEDWCRSWCRTPHTTLKAFIDAGFCSDQEPSREEMRLLRQPALSTVNATKAVISRPAEPADLRELVSGVWYRGWECSYDEMAGYWTGEGYFAALGGADLDCIHVRASTWSDLLDEIDDHDMTEKAA